MKLGFAFLLLTCALLFSQNGTVQPITPEALAKCRKLCDQEAALSAANCQKTAKTDAQMKTCQKLTQDSLSACYTRCSPPRKN
jgi:hypothetical protein